MYLIFDILRYGVVRGVAIEVAVAVYALCALIGYVFGSLNFSVIISKMKYSEDIRTQGSKNGGATNMLRVHGAKAGAITFLLDALKGIVAVTLASLLLGVPGGYFAALFCVIGHIFPVFFNFKGGKGVATAAACILALTPLAFIILVVIFVLMVATTRYVSLGSITAALFFPLVINMLITPFIVIIASSILMMCFIVMAHKPNIQRLLNGTENKLSFKKK